MIQKLKNSLLALSTILFAGAVWVPVTVSAATTPNIQGAACAGSDIKITSDPGANACKEINKDNGNTASGIVKTVINVLTVVVGVLAVIMIIYAGFRYVTSGGNDDAVKGAKNTILYAIIGLVIVALAQIIVHFVLAKLKRATT
jgi:cytochrome bd-type quinol oxidase subunit 2